MVEKPCLLTVKVQNPGGKIWKTYIPAPSDVVSRSLGNPGVDAVIFASGIDAPDSSITVPLTWPDFSCPTAIPALINTPSKTKNNAIPLRIWFFIKTSLPAKYGHDRFESAVHPSPSTA